MGNELSLDELKSDRMIVTMYPPGCGGKFLINALGLSDGVILQSYELAKKQLEGNFTPSDKSELLMSRLSEFDNNKKTRWNDLRLGCIDLFGPKRFDINQNSPREIELIREAIRQNKYFSLIAHNRDEESWSMHHWHNAKVILFKNCQVLTKKESNYLIEDIPHNQFVWDAKWYLSKDNTLTHIKELYDHLLLTDFNYDLVEPYYSKWMQVITKLGRVNG